MNDAPDVWLSPLPVLCTVPPYPPRGNGPTSSRRRSSGVTAAVMGWRIRACLNRSCPYCQCDWSGPEPFFEIGERLGQAAGEDRVAARHGVVSEPAVRRGEPVDEALRVQAPDDVARRLGHDQVAHVGPQTALEADVDRGLDRVLVEHEVPAAQPVAQGRDLRIVELQLAQQGDDVPAPRRSGRHAACASCRPPSCAGSRPASPPPAPARIWSPPRVVQRLPPGIAVGHGVVVRGPVEPLVGVDHAGQRGNRQIAVPLVAGRPPAPARARCDGAGSGTRPPPGNRCSGHGRPRSCSRTGCGCSCARLDELLPRAGLVHAQAREIGSGAIVEPGRAQGVGLVVLAVLVEHRAVAGVLQLDVDRVPGPSRGRGPR